jgi:predicted dehydrogenase
MMHKVHYGVIGIKGVGRHHIRSALQSDNVELTALVDIDAALVKQRSEELGVRGFTDYREMLDTGLVDAVSIATPHHLLAPIGLACLQAGVHIFVEKPFASRVSEAEAMIATAKTKNLQICVGYQYRTYRSSQAMKGLIDTGAIGKILRVLWTWCRFRPESYYVQDRWRATWHQAGGGVLMSQTSHDLDLICWMIGKPVQVSALIGTQLHNTEIEDIACISVLFDNGAFGSIQLTTNQPSSYSVRQVAGEKGIIVIPNVQSLTDDQSDQILLGTYGGELSREVTRLRDRSDQPEITWQTVKLPDDHSVSKKLMRPKALWRRMGLLKTKPHGHAVLMQSFIDAIRNGGEPLVSGESAQPAIEFINAIVLSAIRKKTVELPIDREEYNHLLEELSSGKTQVPRFL